MTILASPIYPVAGGGSAAFINFRSAGVRMFGPTDGLGPHAIAKPPGYQVGDMLVCCMQGTFYTTGTSPTQNPGPWNIIIQSSTQQTYWRVATGDANDDFTVSVLSAGGACTAQMAAFDLSAGPYTSISLAAGGSQLTNSSAYGTAFPACLLSQYNNTQSLTFSVWFKSMNNAIGAVSVIDAQQASITTADEQGTIDSGPMNGLNNNPAGTRSSWFGWSYWITNGTPAEAVAFGVPDQIESPESSGFEVVSHFGARYRITL